MHSWCSCQDFKKSWSSCQDLQFDGFLVKVMTINFAKKSKNNQNQGKKSKIILGIQVEFNYCFLSRWQMVVRSHFSYHKIWILFYPRAKMEVLGSAIMNVLMQMKGALLRIKKQKIELPVFAFIDVSSWAQEDLTVNFNFRRI